MKIGPTSWWAGLCVLAVLGCGSAAQAASITFTETSLGGSNYLFDYTVVTDATDPTYQELTIYFGEALFRNSASPNTTLSAAHAPSGWSPDLAQPSPALGPGPNNGDGFYDVLGLGATGFAPGMTYAGFSVEAFYNGPGMPTASQYFTFVDPDTFDVLASGNATVSTVPLPASGWLLGSAVAALVGARTRRRSRALQVS
jgi:hypothetical protein